MKNEAWEVSVQDAAQRLRVAGSLRAPCAPVRDLLGTEDLERAYAVQLRVVELGEISGDRVVGRRHCSAASLIRGKSDRRTVAGTLSASMAVPDGSVISTSRLVAPKIQVALGVLLGQVPEDSKVSSRDPAIAGVASALVVLDSRIANGDFTLVDAIADNVATGLFLLGEIQEPATLAGGTLRSTLRLGRRTVARGRIDTPLVDLRPRLMGSPRVLPFRSGELVILSTGVHACHVEEGGAYCGVVDGLPEVRVSFAAAVEMATEKRR